MCTESPYHKEGMRNDFDTYRNEVLASSVIIAKGIAAKINAEP